MWCIPAKQDAAFVCAMENVLEVYKRPLDADYPVVCRDETSVQCVKEVRPVRPARSGVMQFYAPFVGWRRIDVEDNHAACTWAEGIRRLVEEDFAGAKRITLVMDNLSTHCGASLYKAFEPEVARRLLDRLEFVYTPKHGSWLNMSECEFSVLLRQCLNRRLPDIDRVRSEVNAWVEVRNGVGNTTHWRFTTEDARIKLRSLYPAKLN